MLYSYLPRLNFSERMMPMISNKKIACVILSIAIFITSIAMPLQVFAASKAHVVSYGESLYDIATWYGTNVDAIKQENGLIGDIIKPGQKLYVPVNGDVYTVQPGETLSDIAAKYGISVDDIKMANNYWDDYILPGQQFIIPITENASADKTVNYSANYAIDRYLLAKIIYAEARGESFEGQVAVGAVILNRLKDPRFPKTIAGIIFQPYAFTAVMDGQFYMEPDEEAYRAADAALGGWDPTGGALYYYNPAKTTSPWIWSRTIITQIGDHIFAR